MYKTSGSQKIVLALISVSVLIIACPSANMLKKATYKGHNRNKYVKYQTINTLDGMIANYVEF